MDTDPISQSHGIRDAESAYAIQDINTKRWLATGRRAVGCKIGLTSKAVQAQLGVDQPDYGILWGDGVAEEGRIVSADAFMQPRIEAEIAFVLKHDLNLPDLSMTQLIA